MKKTLSNVLAKMSVKMAKKACGTASIYGLHQPKEPDMSKLGK